jgi:hypothetical protein
LRKWASVGPLKGILLHALSLKLVESETRLRFHRTYPVVSIKFQQGILYDTSLLQTRSVLQFYSKINVTLNDRNIKPKTLSEFKNKS